MVQVRFKDIKPNIVVAIKRVSALENDCLLLLTMDETDEEDLWFSLHAAMGQLGSGAFCVVDEPPAKM